jgi:hypothetical protein
MGFLDFLKNYYPIIENRVHSASVIKWQIRISSEFHEICYYKIQITKEYCIQYILLFYLHIDVIEFCTYSLRLEKQIPGRFKLVKQNLSNNFL